MMIRGGCVPRKWEQLHINSKLHPVVSLISPKGSLCIVADVLIILCVAELLQYSSKKRFNLSFSLSLFTLSLPLSSLMGTGDPLVSHTSFSCWNNMAYNQPY